MALDFLGDTSKYFGNYTTGDLAGNTFSGVNYDYSLPTSVDTGSLWGSSTLGGGEGLVSDGFNLGNLPWDKIINTLGRFGSGLGTGIATLQSQNNQPNYYLDTQWLGNGLARSNLKSNQQEKQNRLDQLFGAGNMLSNIFGKGFGLFGNGSLNTNLTGNYNEKPFLNWLQQKQDEYGNQTMSFLPLENKTSSVMY